MSVRTTSGAVAGILKPGGDFDVEADSADLNPFIATANAIANRVATCAAAKSHALSASELELIERWLAAHCWVQSDQVWASKSTGGASASFQGQTMMRLENSKYGQMALLLDTSGCLEQITKRQVASGFWLGKAPSAQTDYVDRD